MVAFVVSAPAVAGLLRRPALSSAPRRVPTALPRMAVRAPARVARRSAAAPFDPLGLYGPPSTAATAPAAAPAMDAAAASALLAVVSAGAVFGAPEGALAEVPPALKEAFKTKPASLVHPVVMAGILAAAIYTFWLGYQSSRLRKEEDPAKRKELAQGKFGARHFALSSQILVLMTTMTFIGMANTFTRTGKLFPGPHLYAGLGLVAWLTAMASLVPSMQQGNNKVQAKDAHFALAVGALGLFGWQLNSGLAIVKKLLGI